MRFVLAGLLLVSVCWTGSSGPTPELTTAEFEGVLYRISEGWNQNDARKAADCFALDAVYIEPPDQQLYEGRQVLFEFFGGSSGRSSPMTMTWHHIVFNEAKQIGAAEYTFAYRGRKAHGMVIVQTAEGKIKKWREYQYRSEMDWEEFVGKSMF